MTIHPEFKKAIRQSPLERTGSFIKTRIGKVLNKIMEEYGLDGFTDKEKEQVVEIVFDMLKENGEVTLLRSSSENFKTGKKEDSSIWVTTIKKDEDLARKILYYFRDSGVL